MRGAFGVFFALAQASKYLIITTPEEARDKVVYISLPSGAAETYAQSQIGLTQTSSSSDSTSETAATDEPTKTTLLTDSQGPGGEENSLDYPLGIALDHPRKGLYIADVNKKRILRYELEETEGESGYVLSVKQNSVMVISEGKEVRWLAVDAIGNLFFSDEGDSVIWQVPGHSLIKSTNALPCNQIKRDFMVSQTDSGCVGTPFEKDNPGIYVTTPPTQETPVVVYSREITKTSEVSAPGGLAVDNFHVFWGNKQLGMQVGSVVSGFESSREGKVHQPTKIALNTDRVYGVCIAGNNVYYTDKKTNLYGVKKHGGGIATIYTKMSGPRGCAWDGDGTVYVADRDGNKIMSFPSNMLTLSPQRLKTVTSTDGWQPEGLAVFHSQDEDVNAVPTYDDVNGDLIFWIFAAVLAVVGMFMVIFASRAQPSTR